MKQLLTFSLFLLLLGVVGCASKPSLPRPIVEPSAETKAAGTYDAARDRRACHQAVWDAAPRSIQPHRLIPPVLAPSGVVIGTMDVPHEVLSRDAYQRDMERCLVARGYEIRGWE